MKMLKRIIKAPYFSGIFSSTMVFLGIIFPKDIYESIVGEVNYMFLNINVFLYSIIAFIFLLAGYLIFPYKRKCLINNILNSFILKTKFLLFSYVFILLFVIWILVFNIYVIKTFEQNFFVIVILYGYALIKYSPSFIPFKLGGIPTLLAFASIYYIHIYYKLKVNNLLNKTHKFLFNMVIFLVLFINIITVNRNPLAFMLTGWLLNYLYICKPKLKIRNLFYIFMVSLFLFTLTVYIRFSTLDINAALLNILGYTIASINRFAFQLDYNVDLEPMVCCDNIEDKIEYIEAWHQTLIHYGFNPFFNLSTFYYYVLKNFHILYPLVFALIGFVFKFSFEEFKRGTVFGILMFPYLYLSISTWFIGNILLDNYIFLIYTFSFIILLNLSTYIFTTISNSKNKP